jgi:hypothetical protein
MLRIRALDAPATRFAWLSAMLDGKLVQPVDPKHPCTSCMLTQAVGEQLARALLAHSKLAGDRITTFGRIRGNLSLRLFLRTDELRGWRSGDDINHWVEADEYVWTATGRHLSRLAWDINADTLFDHFIGRVGRKWVIMYVDLEDLITRLGHRVCFMLTDVRPHTEAGAPVDVVYAGTDPAQRLYIFVVENYGYALGDREFAVASAAGATGGLTEERHAAFAATFAGFCRILTQTQPGPTGRQLVSLPGTRTRTSIVHVRLPVFGQVEDACRFLSTFALARHVPPTLLKVGGVGGHCTTIAAMMPVLMLLRGIDEPPVPASGYAAIADAARQGGMSTEELLDRISFNAMQLWALPHLDMCCTMLTASGHPSNVRISINGKVMP